MAKTTLQDRLGPHADTFYAELRAAHRELSVSESHALNARLVLMLANEIADPERLTQLLIEARHLSAE